MAVSSRGPGSTTFAPGLTSAIVEVNEQQGLVVHHLAARCSFDEV